MPVRSPIATARNVSRRGRCCRMPISGKWTGSSRASSVRSDGTWLSVDKVMTSALELSGISKSFDGFRAIAAADLEVRSGEVHALLGENGAGKSSLMNIVAGLYAPDDGSIRVQGRPVLID